MRIGSGVFRALGLILLPKPALWGGFLLGAMHQGTQAGVGRLFIQFRGRGDAVTFSESWVVLGSPSTAVGAAVPWLRQIIEVAYVRQVEILEGVSSRTI